MEPLAVVRATPTGDAQTVPEVVVNFSRPMVPIAGVAAVDARAVPARLSSQPAGRWTWIDPRALRFEPTARLAMATRYVVEVPAGTRSTSGAVLSSRGVAFIRARIVEPLEKKPWGLRQFTLEDIDGNRFHFHCD